MFVGLWKLCYCVSDYFVLCVHLVCTLVVSPKLTDPIRAVLVVDTGGSEELHSKVKAGDNGVTFWWATGWVGQKYTTWLQWQQVVNSLHRLLKISHLQNETNSLSLRRDAFKGRSHQHRSSHYIIYIIKPPRFAMFVVLVFFSSYLLKSLSPSIALYRLFIVRP